MKLPARWLILALLSALSLGGAPLRAADSHGGQAALNDGYSLFYDFCNQESELSLLFWIKSAPHDIADYGARISTTAKDDMAILKKFAADDSSIRLDKIPLPSFENSVRTSMAADRKQQLVWDDSGAHFTQAICMTQSEVTNYGMHVRRSSPRRNPMRIARGRWASSIRGGWRCMRRLTS